MDELRPDSTTELIPGFDHDENEARVRALIDLIASGEAVALVGAGLSMAAGYQSWPGLLEQLADRANAIRPGFLAGPKAGDARDYLALAQRIRDHIADPAEPAAQEVWYDEVGRLFYRTPEIIRDSLTSVHRDLVQLPFRAFLTTNFDEVLEVALKTFHPARPGPQWVCIWNGNDLGLLSRAVRGIAVSGDAANYVLHLHGMYRAGSSLVLCADEYARAYGISDLALLGPKSLDGSPSSRPPAPLRPTRLFLLTTALLSTRRVVFVGFSLDDLYFTEVLSRVSDMLWEWHTATHFAIMPIEPEKAADQLLRAADLKQRRGIETVFFPVIHGNYTALDALISRIARELEVRRGEASPYAGERTVDAEPTAAVMPAWVGRNNAEQLARFEPNED